MFRSIGHLLLLAGVVVFLAAPARALVTIETVTVGDEGNAGELSGAGAGGWGPDRVCGTVGYSYAIGTYEVTNGQYIEFLNAVASTSDVYGLYSTDMSGIYGGISRNSDGGGFSYGPKDADSAWLNRPVNFVSFWDACRFANWLHNGQPSGVQGATTTEDGAYTLNGYNGSDGRTISRNGTATWVIPTEDEWYKAAYYKGGGTNAGYWDYATKSDILPAGVPPSGDTGNSANYYDEDFAEGSPYYSTVVGAYAQSAGPYGTFDQNGNVWEWNETIAYETSETARRGMRGGAWSHSALALAAAERYYGDDPSFGYFNIGFRVAAISWRIPGDANLDGDVDLGDLFTVRNYFGLPGEWRNGDFDGDGIVDLDDLFDVRNNFGYGTAAAPEPVTSALMAVGGLSLLRRRRRSCLRR